MVKCYICGLEYEENQGVSCPRCEAKPSGFNMSDLFNPKKTSKDKQRNALVTAGRLLKRDMYIDGIGFISGLIFFGLSTFAEMFALLGTVSLYIWFFWRLFVVIRIRYLLIFMDKKRGTVFFSQLLALLLPFGEILIGIDTLFQLKDMLKKA